MPTYEYRCPENHEFEHFFTTISRSKEVMPCPTCGKDAQRLVSGGAGLLFKGSGFYITDYGKDGKKADRERANKSGSKEPGAGSEGARSEGGSSRTESTESKPSSSESKPAKKPDAGE
ncbi:MAG TPA: zinc ribbon domain-containing protein [Gemmatimonadaceae bacterium]|nr:zinc ribbon domain-containing protein [Gemmatimonadaceae bacterium]